MTQNLYSNREPDPSVADAEETLRRVAELPPPAGLTDRVHYRLKDARAASARRGFWSLWMPAQRLQYAGAALLVLAIAGSAWTVRHTASGGSGKSQAPLQSTGKPIAQPIVQPAPPSVQQGSGFVPASSETRPSNLTPIKVPPAPKKKPSASRPLTKRTPKPGATAQAESGTPVNP